MTNWDEKYQKGEVFWDKGAPSPGHEAVLRTSSRRTPDAHSSRDAVAATK